MTKGQHSKTSQNKKKHSTSFRVLTVCIVVCLAIAACVGGYLLWVNYQTQKAEPVSTTETTEENLTTESEDSTVQLVDNPIDFTTLQAENPEIKAWITVPNTNVDYAVCQSATDDTFYLDHDSNGDYSLPGAIYFERANSTNLSDPVTVIYGHDGYGDTMFSTLHYYDDADFFNANPYFYVYAPGHIYTYEIISAFMYDDRHILVANNYFLNTSDIQQYHALISAPESLVCNVRSGVALTDESKMVTLSTCMEERVYANNRFLVNGVLINDQLTR